MGINFNLARKYAGEKILRQGIKYIQKDPVANIEKLLDIAEKLVIRNNHREWVRLTKENYRKYPLIMEYIHKIKDIAPSYRDGLLMNFSINAGLYGIPYQYEMAEKLGVSVPWTILIDPTSACNLKCEGCWAGKYNKTDSLDFETFDRLISEAKELGIYFIVLSGGEPTLYPRLFDIFAKHNDVAFMMYTNGTLIDEEFADRMLEVGNVSPAISLEGLRETTDGRRGKGVFDRIMMAMDLLRERGIIFGVSVTATRNNIDEVFGEEFIDLMIEKGALYMWSFHYIPIGRNPDLDLMLTPEQRAELAKRVPEIRSKKPIFVMDFWNDGIYTKGCIAGGKRYFHINARGDAEPCAFVHFAVDNVKDKSLQELLQNTLFKAYQKRIPFSENYMAPCPIIDNPQALRDMVEESSAYPTHDGADNVLGGETAKFLDELSETWLEISQEIHEDRMSRRLIR
ncbi:MAG: radical SAM protein [Bacillota bacterium]|nr:radical SAM protein [Bacillota bacterium]